MARKIKPEQQRQKDRMAAARKEILAALSEHECFLYSEGNSGCWICNRPYVDGKFCNMPAFMKAPVEPAHRRKKPKVHECFCTKDEDGECGSCRKQVVEAVNAVGIIFRDSLQQMEEMGKALLEKIKEGKSKYDISCLGCSQKYMDFGLSKIVEAVKDCSKETAESTFSVVLDKMASKGSPGPLTKKAWADICREKGWTGSSAL